MVESVGSIFSIRPKDPGQMSPLTLAFVGDAAYELIIRTYIAGANEQSPHRMQKMGAFFAKAATQARMARELKGNLTKEELDILRRGRNAHPASMAKNATMADYRMATALEALIGYLYLSGREERAVWLVKAGADIVRRAAAPGGGI